MIFAAVAPIVAAAAGIVAGDTIVAIDGRAASSLSLGDYAALSGTTPGSTVTYTIVAVNGTQRVVTLKTIDLLPR